MIPTTVKTKFIIALDVLSKSAAIKTNKGNMITIDSMALDEIR